MNPHAKIYDRQKDLEAVKCALLSSAVYELRGAPDKPQGWLNSERLTFTPAHDPSDRNHVRSHDPVHHSGGIKSHCILVDEPLCPRLFERFLNTLESRYETGLLRMKGVFCLADDPARTVFAQSVRHAVQRVDRRDGWPRGDRRTRIVLIGEKLDIDAICTMLNARKASI